MSIFSRLAIGTANWRDKPYGHRHTMCGREEQEKIIEYCLRVGIRWIDTATAYGVDLSWIPQGFTTFMKVTRSDDLRVGHGPGWIRIAHKAFETKEDKRYMCSVDGVSFYDPEERTGCVHQAWWNVPYSPFDRRWEDLIKWNHDSERGLNIVRSVFCQGKVFDSDEPPFVRFRKFAGEMGIPVGTLCILFCLMNPNVDVVIIGVDSCEQLRDDLRFFERLDGFGVDDPKIIDPRRWNNQ